MIPVQFLIQGLPAVAKVSTHMPLIQASLKARGYGLSPGSSREDLKALGENGSLSKSTGGTSGLLVSKIRRSSRNMAVLTGESLKRANAAEPITPTRVSRLKLLMTPRSNQKTGRAVPKAATPKTTGGVVRSKSVNSLKLRRPTMPLSIVVTAPVAAGTNTREIISSPRAVDGTPTKVRTLRDQEVTGAIKRDAQIEDTDTPRIPQTFRSASEQAVPSHHRKTETMTPIRPHLSILLPRESTRSYVNEQSSAETLVETTPGPQPQSLRVGALHVDESQVDSSLETNSEESPSIPQSQVSVAKTRDLPSTIMRTPKAIRSTSMPTSVPQVNGSSKARRFPQRFDSLPVAIAASPLKRKPEVKNLRAANAAAEQKGSSGGLDEGSLSTTQHREHQYGYSSLSRRFPLAASGGAIPIAEAFRDNGNRPGAPSTGEKSTHTGQDDLDLKTAVGGIPCPSPTLELNDAEKTQPKNHLGPSRPILRRVTQSLIGLFTRSQSERAKEERDSQWSVSRSSHDSTEVVGEVVDVPLGPVRHSWLTAPLRGVGHFARSERFHPLGQSGNIRGTNTPL